MKKYISQLRSQYQGEVLDETLVSKDPLKQFKKWFKEVIDAEIADPNAMIIATASKMGIPSVRTVLLKDFDETGFTFYTNYNSKKGKELEENPYASFLFFWPQLYRQIRIDGMVSQIDPSVSEKYFKERPRESQISAWASAQSTYLESKSVLEKNYKDFENNYKNKEIPYPAFWGGYCLKPYSYEFWQGQPDRLHDRVQYSFDPEEENWCIKRLAP